MTKKGNKAMAKIKLLTIAIISIYGMLSLGNVCAQIVVAQNNGGATGTATTGANATSNASIL